MEVRQWALILLRSLARHGDFFFWCGYIRTITSLILADTRRLLSNHGLRVFVLLIDHPQSAVAQVSRSALRILAIYGDQSCLQYVVSISDSLFFFPADDTRIVLNKFAVPKLIGLLGSLRLTSESRTHECQLIAMGIMEDLAVYRNTVIFKVICY